MTRVQVSRELVLQFLSGLVLVALGAAETQAKYGGGTGTVQDPYQIWTAEQMNAIGTDPSDYNKNFKLMADLDLAAYQGDSFHLIGFFDGPQRRIYSFWGVFDGNGHTLSNLTYTITGPDPNDPTANALRAYGIFRYLSGEVRNLGIINPTIRPAATCTYWVGQVGALAGYCYRGFISNCYVQGGHIAADDSAGGLVGIFGSSSSSTVYAAVVADCYASCAVSCSLRDHPAPLGGVVSACFGGLVGSCQGTILRSSARGDVNTVEAEGIGGLVGDLMPKGTVDACFATGRVSGGNVQGKRFGYNIVGGLIGRVDENSLVRASYSLGPVSGVTRIGGLIGYARMEATIHDCYSRGSVTGHEMVGGLVGELDRGGALDRCYATGAVSGALRAGGLIGSQDDRLPRSNCFWDRETSGLSKSDGGVGLTTAGMQDPRTYAAARWDFAGASADGADDIWQMKSDASAYPQLAWEPPSEAFLAFDLTENPGWTLDGPWQFGKPAGQGGATNGNPDPTGGYTGDNVYGVNLQGDYNLGDRDPHYLTCGPLDCGAYHHVLLQFARWLNTDEADFVEATVEVSPDGSAWHTVWRHLDVEAGLMDDAWRVVTYDISAWADRCRTLYVRWGHHVLDPEAWEFSGWNIDDVKLLGVK